MSADNLFKGAVISVLAENLIDSYMQLPSGKAVWDAPKQIPGKAVWDAPRQISGYPMQGASCTS